MVCDNPAAYAIKRARRHGIATVVVNPRLFKSRESYERFIVRILKNEAIDAVVLAGFMRILTPYFIRQYKNRILNIHPSLLPAFKGAHAIRDAFEAGASKTGVTVHVVTAKVDAGPVVMQKAVAIQKNDTLKRLEKKIHAVEHTLYPKAIKKYLATLS